MSQCLNCKARITCSCQRARGKDGKACCTGCVTTYNASLAKSQPAPPVPSSPNTPTNITATYNGPGKQIN